MRNCWFCNNHEAGQSLYEFVKLNTGYYFDEIHIAYCPICGNRLPDLNFYNEIYNKSLKKGSEWE